MADLDEWPNCSRQFSKKLLWRVIWSIMMPNGLPSILSVKSASCELTRWRIICWCKRKHYWNFINRYAVYCKSDLHSSAYFAKKNNILLILGIMGLRKGSWKSKIGLYTNGQTQNKPMQIQHQSKSSFVFLVEFHLMLHTYISTFVNSNEPKHNDGRRHRGLYHWYPYKFFALRTTYM